MPESCNKLSPRRGGGLLAALRALQPGLSRTEQQVARYVCRHPQQVPLQSVHEVARQAGVSVASVSRLARQVGGASFKEFKIGLARETAAPVAAVYRAISAADADDEVVRKVFAGNIQSLQDTLRLLAPRDCGRAARAINRADQVAFFGIGSSGCVAQEAALRFAHLGVPAVAATAGYEMVVRAMSLRKSSVVVGISHSGRSTATVNAARLARAQGATTIGISSSLTSPLRAASDIFLCATFGEPTVRAVALAAGAAQTSLMDALYVLVARLRKITPQADRLNAAVEDCCRLPARKR